MDNDKPRKPLGQLLKEKGLITEEHIRFVLLEQKRTKEKIGEILERFCIVTEYDIVNSLSQQEGVPYLDVDEVIPENKVLKMFNKNLCLNNMFLPIGIKHNSIEVAVEKADDSRVQQLISRQTGLRVKKYLSESRKIINAINKYYYFMENPINAVIDKEVNSLVSDKEMVRSTENLFKYLMHLAVKMRATDIHIRPMEKTSNVSFRIDGVMIPVISFPSSLKRIIASIKLKSEMDIAEQRLPQDGRFTETILNNGYDFRASTSVSPYGENIVLRMLPMQGILMGMGQLGFFKKDIEKLGTMFNEPFGIILLTGPTGSGKSTTLYAGIRTLDLLHKNVLTVEDPIEYTMPLIRQTQVNEKAGYNFANAIRYFLRHDPDVILVGEIRDKETAETAFSASTTGHLVLSTLHANSAIGVISRLRDLDVRPFLIADSLIGIINQRLVRRICTACKEAYTPDEDERRYLREPSLEVLYRGKGCQLCEGTGYLGRTLVYEVLTLDRELSQMIEQEADLTKISDRAGQKGFENVFKTTVEKVKAGITTTDEARRVIGHLRLTEITTTDEARRVVGHLRLT
ncbi:MAG: ATPase, T2SS/T4P/T4SS family [Thermodesulfobacteriota bacterium]|nr:ATPase, T2SS/T4P/T4SS family [Thermodesulfobacteriota bacterium]